MQWLTTLWQFAWILVALCQQKKTERATTVIVFLGMLLDGEQCLISIPVDKKIRPYSYLRGW